MTTPTQPLSDYTSDTRILARCARGFDWNYIAAGETFSTANGTTVSTTLSTVGATGYALEHNLTVTVAGGGWMNSLYGMITYGTSGSCSGIGSAVCGEVLLSAGTSVGRYAAFEGELGAGSGAKCTGSTGFFYLNGYGADVATTIDTTAVFAALGPGLTVGAGKFIDTNKTSLTAVGGLRLWIDGVGLRWIPVVSA